MRFKYYKAGADHIYLLVRPDDSEESLVVVVYSIMLLGSNIASVYIYSELYIDRWLDCNEPEISNDALKSIIIQFLNSFESDFNDKLLYLNGIWLKYYNNKRCGGGKLLTTTTDSFSIYYSKETECEAEKLGSKFIKKCNLLLNILNNENVL